MDDASRFQYLAAGRRWRKTTLGMRKGLKGASVRGEEILWGAPTYRQCRIGWTEFSRAAGGIADFHKGDMEITFPPFGAKMSFVSLDDPDNARGKTADGVILDEAAYVQQRAWYDVIRPMISDTDGWLLALGTPLGHNWFWRECQAAGDREDSAFWQVPTLGVVIENGVLVRRPHPMENPYFSFAEAELMYQRMPERTFQQEFLAEFIEDAGLVFRNVRARSTAQPSAPEEGHRYVFGVDWAKAYDWTVVSVLDATDKRQVAMDRFNQIDYTFQVGRLQVMAERWKPEDIIAEANAMGEPLVEQLHRAGLPVEGFTTSPQSKTRIIEALALALERGKITLLDDETQIGELQAYGMKRLPGGSFRYSAPQGMHDDTVMALALAWEGVASEMPPPYGQIESVDAEAYKPTRGGLWA